MALPFQISLAILTGAFLLGTIVLEEAKGEIKIASFNIKTFNTDKFESRAWVREVLLKIFCMHDVTFVMETKEMDVLESLIDELNKFAADPKNNCQGRMYKALSSELVGPVGCRPAQELYAYIYAMDKVTLSDDSPLGLFEKARTKSGNSVSFVRPPFSVKMQFNVGAKTYTFLLMGMHARAAKYDVVDELNYLEQVYKDEYSDDYPDGLIIGDFNADCSYLSNAEFDNLKFSMKKITYHWLLSKTKKDTDYTNLGEFTRHKCVYDNMIIAGGKGSFRDSQIFKCLKRNYVLRYLDLVKTAIGVANPINACLHALVETVSDHYPTVAIFDCM